MITKFRKQLKAKGGIVLFLSFIAISICAICVSGAMRLNRKIERESRNFYSEHARNTTLYEFQENDFLQELYSEKAGEDYIIYKNIDDPELDIRGVLYSGKVTLPNMLSGEFLEEGYLKGNDGTAVVGRSFENLIKKENGESYFYYNDLKLKVLGIMGEKNTSRMNEMIFVDMASAIKNSGVNGEYVIDGKDPDKLDRLAENIEYMSSEKGKVSIAGEYIESGVAWFFAKERITGTMYTLILCSFLITTVMVSFLWMSQKKRKVAVMRLQGYSNGEIICEIAKEYYGFAVVGFGIGLVIAIALVWRLGAWNTSLEDVFTAFVVTLGFGVCGLVLPAIKVLRLQVSEILA
ncbi:MAG: ABC transporter permease [Lachnospiraceae bacterium]|nr:ABC transporter permease [Lachnospiraceae bacterium]